MYNRKILFVLFCFCFSLGFAQTKVSETRREIDYATLSNFDFEKHMDSLVKASFVYPIDSTNCFSFLQKARKMADTSDVTTNLNAVKLLYKLNYFDRHKYSYEVLLPILKKLESNVIQYHKEQILGDWKSEAMGDNWNVGVFVNPNTRVVFMPNQMLYYKNDSLVRKTGYSITNSPRFTMSKFVLYLTVEFTDGRTPWVLYLMDKGSSVPYHGKATKTYLYFVREPGCLCGCDEELFSRKL